MVLGKLGAYAKNEIGLLSYIIKKNNSKWIKDLNMGLPRWLRLCTPSVEGMGLIPDQEGSHMCMACPSPHKRCEHETWNYKSPRSKLVGKALWHWLWQWSFRSDTESKSNKIKTKQMRLHQTKFLNSQKKKKKINKMKRQPTEWK